MIDSDKKEFLGILEDAFEIYDKTISGGKLRIYFEVLKGYDLSSVRIAISSHISKSKFAPRPADILDQLGEMDGRPDENEAWAIALSSQDENETVVWTSEMSEAFFVASKILAVGDEQGAKMAFREVYSRLVVRSRGSLIPVAWRVSLGADKERLNVAIDQAKASGKITNKAHAKYFIEPIIGDGLAIAGLLSGKVMSQEEEDELNEETRRNLDEARQVIAATKSHQEKYRESQKLRRDEANRKKKLTERYANESLGV